MAQLKKEPVEQTKLVFHLQKMLKLLLEEQNETSPSSSPSKSPRKSNAMALKPCLEFLLHQNVLDTLVTLCQVGELYSFII